VASKRMIAIAIIDSDVFLEMPASTQNLYFHLNMRADDDGFVHNPKKIMRMIGAAEDDMKVLLTKRYLLMFDSGVIVIKHWRLHNTIQKDRYKPTLYQDEYKQLFHKENKAYTDNVNNGSNLDPQVRLDQIRSDKVSKEEASDKPGKHKYGEYKNVLLTDEEYAKLKKQFTDYEYKIKKLDEGIEMKGYKYKNHYLTVLKWAERDGKEKQKSTADYVNVAKPVCRFEE